MCPYPNILLIRSLLKVNLGAFHPKDPPPIYIRLSQVFLSNIIFFFISYFFQYIYKIMSSNIHNFTTHLHNFTTFQLVFWRGLDKVINFLHPHVYSIWTNRASEHHSHMHSIFIVIYALDIHSNSNSYLFCSKE